jgi:hypothetical protein
MIAQKIITKIIRKLNKYYDFYKNKKITIYNKIYNEKQNFTLIIIMQSFSFSFPPFLLKCNISYTPISE